MLLCKACNTRFSDGATACPSCGRRHFSKVGDGPDAKAEEPARLAEARPLRGEPEPDPVDQADPVELDEIDVLASAVDPAAADELKPDPPGTSGSRAALREPGPAVFELAAAQVRTLVTEQPDLLEPGLAIYSDERRAPVGVDYRTPVGAIDLLATDADGNLVVVMVPDLRDTETLVPQLLARLGYIRKHLATEARRVRGLVVIEDVPEALAYAAAGLSDMVSFKTFRVALSFHELAI